MREIKFRAWDREKRKFYPESLGMYNHLPANWQKFYILQQYTGLKDKNGREIYEGDIITEEFYTKTFEIIWDEEGGLEDGSLNPEEWIIGFRFPAGDSYEVIGNIYENPELTTLH